MTTLRIEHEVPDYEAWKQAFDGDPMGRERAGVRRYKILRGAEDPKLVMIDLEFDDAVRAESVLAGLQQLWSGAGGGLVIEPRARIAEQIESVEY